MRCALRREAPQVDTGVILVDGREPILGRSLCFGTALVTDDHSLLHRAHQTPVAGAFSDYVLQQFHGSHTVLPDSREVQSPSQIRYGYWMVAPEARSRRTLIESQTVAM